MKAPACPSLRDAWLQAFLDALGASPAAHQAACHIQWHGQGALASAYPVTDLACASMAAAACVLAGHMSSSLVSTGPAGGTQPAPPSVQVDVALASAWFGYTLQPVGWQIPKVRDAVTGDYRTRDGWIRIHANAAHHRARALQVLGLGADATRQAVAAQVQRWQALALEDALVQADACAAALRTPQAWAQHPQGLAVAAEPLVHYLPGLPLPGSSPSPAAVRSVHVPLDPLRPLAGLTVLDLTRVLAGPVCTRWLAAYGAQVLRLDPVGWEEPGMVPEVTVGKRCAALNLRDAAGRAQFVQLLAQADVLVHGYRPDALERLGLGTPVRQRIRPGLVDVSLNAWGWTGPWRGRRGFDSLVQMSTGIAWPASGTAAAEPSAGHLAQAMAQGDGARPDPAGCTPAPLPVQALDQSAGYWMAACVMQGLQQQAAGQGSVWRVSLARMAALLASGRVAEKKPALGPVPLDAAHTRAEDTEWGPARRLLPPCVVGEATWHWDGPAGPLRRHPALFP
ncbi:CoA transferase [Castellaniella sp.]|uniref:CoA transferase n=1 Tax=Castellaniella sp. TaxID=1955812 RepID=UPI003C7653F4